MGKPIAGIVLLSANWFDEVEVQQELTNKIEHDVEKILNTIGKYFEPVFTDTVTNERKAKEAIESFNKNSIDLIIIVHVMWSEDGPLIKVLKAFKHLPIILWGYNPYKKLPEKMTTQQLFRSSGAVGLLQGSAPMKKIGTDINFVFGHPEDDILNRELYQFAAAFSVINSLEEMKIGQLAGRCEAMTGTYVDEFRLLEKLGVKLVHITPYQLKKISQKIPEKRVKSYKEYLKNNFPVENVSDKSLDISVRVSLGVDELTKRNNLDALAIEDLNDELHKILNTRPCLGIEEMFDRDVVIGMEGDVITTLAAWIVRKLGGTSPMYTEIFTYDETENSVLAGHAAMHDIRLAGDNIVKIVPDYEYMRVDPIEGAWTQFTAKPGEVQLVSMFSDRDNYRVIVTKGEALRVEDKLEGFAHMLIKLDLPLKEFFEKIVSLGVTQHFAITYEDVKGPLKKLAQLLDIEYIELT